MVEARAIALALPVFGSGLCCCARWREVRAGAKWLKLKRSFAQLRQVLAYDAWDMNLSRDFGHANPVSDQRVADNFKERRRVSQILGV